MRADGFANVITGGGGRDILIGAGLADELVGGAGNDVMRGGDGGDRYSVGVGGGIDVVDDDGAAGIDALALGVTGSAARLSLAGGGLFVDLGGGDGVQVTGFDPLDAYGSGTIERVMFTDGELSYAQLVDRGFDLAGGAGADVISGTNAVDRFDGRGGNDRLIGGKGNDSYAFGKGSGHDLVVDEDLTAGNFDRVVMKPGVAAADVAVEASADRLTLRLRGSDDRLDIQWIPDTGLMVEEVAFDDGTRWDLDALKRMFAPANTPPGLKRPLGDQLAREDAQLGFRVPDGTFEDANQGDPLTYSAALADGSALPGWLQFDAATRTFSGTPLNDDVGVLSVTVTAADSTGATASDTFDIVVANANDAPELAAPIGKLVVDEDAPLDFTVPAGTFRDIDAGDEVKYLADAGQGRAASRLAALRRCHWPVHRHAVKRRRRLLPRAPGRGRRRRGGRRGRVRARRREHERCADGRGGAAGSDDQGRPAAPARDSGGDVRRYRSGRGARPPRDARDRRGAAGVARLQRGDRHFQRHRGAGGRGRLSRTHHGDRRGRDLGVRRFPDHRRRRTRTRPHRHLR